MAQQPQLYQSTPAIGAIHMNAAYCKEYFDTEKTVADGPHIHSCYEIYVNLSGDVSFLHDRGIYDVRPFDVVISAPSDVHRCIFHSSGVHEHFCLWFESDVIGAFLHERGLRGRVHPQEESLPRIQMLLHALCREEDGFLRAVYLLELVSLFAVGERGKECSSDRMDEILRYVREHLSEPLSVSQVANAFFLSYSTLNRRFRLHLGIPFYKYLESQRLSLAERLLREGRSVTEVAFLSGFSDCSRFILKFKERFGTTPLKYQKRLLHAE